MLTVAELIEYLGDFDPDLPVKIAYQPDYPMAERAELVQEAEGKNYHGKEERAVYICSSTSGGNEYAPRCLYND